MIDVTGVNLTGLGSCRARAGLQGSEGLAPFPPVDLPAPATRSGQGVSMPVLARPAVPSVPFRHPRPGPLPLEG
jgi:hypothetical protein